MVILLSRLATQSQVWKYTLLLKNVAGLLPLFAIPPSVEKVGKHDSEEEGEVLVGLHLDVLCACKALLELHHGLNAPSKESGSHEDVEQHGVVDFGVL